MRIVQCGGRRRWFTARIETDLRTSGLQRTQPMHSGKEPRTAYGETRLRQPFSNQNRGPISLDRNGFTSSFLLLYILHCFAFQFSKKDECSKLNLTGFRVSAGEDQACVALLFLKHSTLDPEVTSCPVFELSLASTGQFAEVEAAQTKCCSMPAFHIDQSRFLLGTFAIRPVRCRIGPSIALLHKLRELPKRLR